MGDNSDPWAGALAQANSGSLKFDDQAALGAAQLCSIAMGRVAFVQQQLRLANLDKLQSFTGGAVQFPSGATLANVFSSIASDLDQALTAHINILQEMAETFIAAGKTYHAAEISSANNFNTDSADTFNPDMYNNVPLNPGPIQDSTQSPLQISQNAQQPPPPPVPPDASWDILKHLDTSGRSPGGIGVDTLPLQGMDAYIPASFTNYWQDRVIETVPQDNPDSYQWHDFYQLGTNINWQTAATASATWGWMASELSDVFQMMQNKLADILNNNMWQGPGAAAAISASMSYAAESYLVAPAAQLMADNLNFTAGWLNVTQTVMPKEPWPPVTITLGPDGDYNVTDMTSPEAEPTLRFEFGCFYNGGLNATTQNIPVITAPPSPVVVPPASTITAPTTSGSGDGGNGSFGRRGGGYSSGGPGSGGVAIPTYTPAGLPTANRAGIGDVPGGVGTGLRNGVPGNGVPADFGSGAGSVVPGLGSGTGVGVGQAGGLGSRTATGVGSGVGTAPGTSGVGTAASGSSAAQSTQNALSQLSGAGEQALQAMQQGASALQAANGLSQLGSRAGLVDGAHTGNPSTGSQTVPKGSMGRLGGGDAGVGVGNGAEDPPKYGVQNSRLFPRAGLDAGQVAMPPSVDDAAMLSRAGAAPYGGMPGGMGMGNAGAGEKERKRPNYLNSAENLNEAIGDAPPIGKPVIGAAGSPPAKGRAVPAQPHEERRRPSLFEAAEHREAPMDETVNETLPIVVPAPE